MKRFLFNIILFAFLAWGNIFGQFNSFNAGAGIGAGEITGNSTPQSAFSIKLFADFKTWFSEDVSFRASYHYARKIEYFLPENRNGKYYPYLHSFSFQAFMDQKLTGLIFIEEGAGLSAVNDRTFSDTNEWDFGTEFSFLGGLDLRNDLSKGFRLGVNLDYGITFTGTTANFYLVSLQTQYFF